MTLSLCASAQARQRIINGSPASPGEYPAQGVLQFATASFICGGTLVSNRYFLTAGHCVAERRRPGRSRRATSASSSGNVDRDAGAELHVLRPRSTTDYAMVDEVPDNDVALFTLSTPAPASAASRCG